MSVPAQIPISGPYIANGVTTQFAYKFYLLFATDMQVFVGGLKKTLNTDYTVNGVGNSQGGNVVFTTAPASGLEVLIKRATPYTRQTDYADNGDLLADVVNDDFDRIWLALQEINANFSSSISKAVGGNWDAQSLRIMSVADGTQPQDAATVNQLNNVNGSAGQSAAAAADSAATAKNSESNAASSQQAAASSASAASVSAGNSSDSANLAQKWAVNPVGTEVTAGKYSAFHYASKASDSAASASNSAANASTSATNASNSAGAAAQSATSAKSDADRAQSANPDNQLKKANNLSDVTDKATAWKNIAQFGSGAGQAVEGNDVRLATIDGNSGGVVTSSIGLTKAGSSFYKEWVSATGDSSFRRNELGRAYAGYSDRQAYGSWDFAESVGNYYAIRLVCVNNEQQGNSVAMDFRGNGVAYNPGGWQTYSDVRTKENITVIADPIERLFKMRGYTFKKFGIPGAGVLAQEAIEAVPEVVTDSGDLVMPNNGATIKHALSLSPGDLVGLLIEVCRNQEERLQAIEKAEKNAS